MAQYKVRSGQNIFDVAITLYGSIEGVFDLIASNPWLNMETHLSYGMVLEYHEEFVINQSVVTKLSENSIIVKNGDHICTPLDVKSHVQNHIESEHQDIVKKLLDFSTDEQNMFWEQLYTPKMIIHQQGVMAVIKFALYKDTHLIIDWGDYSEVQILEGDDDIEIEHCYKSAGQHKITLYGDFKFHTLDFTELNGLYYPLSYIYADKFTSVLNLAELNMLIITK